MQPHPIEPSDYRMAFDLAPVGLVLSRQRLMVDCNQALLDIFGAPREAVVGRSFEVLYPSADEFERTGQRIIARLDQRGVYADERVMKRLGGRPRRRALLVPGGGPRARCAPASRGRHLAL